MIYIIKSSNANNNPKSTDKLKEDNFKPIHESYENDFKPIDESNEDNLKLNPPSQDKVKEQYTAHTIYEISMEEPNKLDIATLETKKNRNISLSKETLKYRKEFNSIQEARRKQIEQQKAEEFKLKSSIPDKLSQKLDDMWNEINKQ